MAEQTLTEKIKAARAIFASLTPEQAMVVILVIQDDFEARPKRGRPPNAKAIPEQPSLSVEDEA